jgi:hypothetical protein
VRYAQPPEERVTTLPFRAPLYKKEPRNPPLSLSLAVSLSSTLSSFSLFLAPTSRFRVRQRDHRHRLPRSEEIDVGKPPDHLLLPSPAIGVAGDLPNRDHHLLLAGQGRISVAFPVAIHMLGCVRGKPKRKTPKPNPWNLGKGFRCVSCVDDPYAWYCDVKSFFMGFRFSCRCFHDSVERLSQVIYEKLPSHSGGLSFDNSLEICHKAC